MFLENVKDVSLRLLNLFALLGATAWLARAPDWEPLLAFIGLLAAMIGQEASPVLKGKDKDKVLFEKFLLDFPSNGLLARFLNEQDIGVPFRSEELHQLYAFIDNWNNAEHEFLNSKLESQKKKLYSLAAKFRIELGPSIFSDVGGFLTMDIKDMEDNPERLKKRDYLNELASQVFREHQELIRLGKRLT